MSVNWDHTDSVIVYFIQELKMLVLLTPEFHSCLLKQKLEAGYCVLALMENTSRLSELSRLWGILRNGTLSCSG